MPVSLTVNNRCCAPRCAAVRLLFVEAHGDVHVALLGELDAVADEVQQHLAHASDVADQAARHVVGDLQRELDVLLGGARREQVEHFLHRLVEVVCDVFQLDAAGLDLREVQDVVDDDQQALGGAADRARRSRSARASSLVSSSRLLKPITPFIGVRISWLIAARNSLLARLAASASSRASVSCWPCASMRAKASSSVCARSPSSSSGATRCRAAAIAGTPLFDCGSDAIDRAQHVMSQLAPSRERQQQDDDEQAAGDLQRIADEIATDRAHVHAHQDCAALLAVGAQQHAVDGDRRDEIEVGAVAGATRIARGRRSRGCRSTALCRRGSRFACRSIRFERLDAMMRWLPSTATISEVSGDTLTASTTCCSSLFSSRLSVATLIVSMSCTAR